MKTPMTLGHKKAKAIEQLLDELGIREYSLCVLVARDFCVVVARVFVSQ